MDDIWTTPGLWWVRFSWETSADMSPINHRQKTASTNDPKESSQVRLEGMVSYGYPE